VPLAGTYECSFESVQARNLYDNHPGLAEVYDKVREKIAKEEAQSFHLALPHFLWHFLPGIHLAPMIWALCKGKGRVCVDPSTELFDDDDGATNSHIPAPGEDKCPAIHYALALHQHLTQIWNLNLQHYMWLNIHL